MCIVSWSRGRAAAGSDGRGKALSVGMQNEGAIRSKYTRRVRILMVFDLQGWIPCGISFSVASGSSSPSSTDAGAASRSKSGTLLMSNAAPRYVHGFGKAGQLIRCWDSGVFAWGGGLGIRVLL